MNAPPPQVATAVRALAQAIVRQSATVAASWPDGVPDEAAVTARLASGVPALDGEPLLGARELLAAGRCIGVVLQAAEPDAGRTMMATVARLESIDPAILVDLVRIALTGAWDALPPFAASLDLDDYALLTVLDYAARPALLAGATRIRPLLTPGELTGGRRCPACGGAPLLAELSGKDGARTLRCGRCGTGWRYPRVACAWCGERDSRALSALHGEGDAGVRQADCCAHCRGYLKALSVLDPFDYVALQDADLATTGLDLVAVDQGYARGGAVSRRGAAHTAIQNAL